jgi:uncharacterized protein (DUF433 family)
MAQRIEISPGVRFGKPCVAGTRIAVHEVLELVRDGVSFETVVKDFYPDLTVEDIRACVQFALDILTVEELHTEDAAA